MALEGQQPVSAAQTTMTEQHGSAAWQPHAAAESLEHLAHYLDRVSHMPMIQDVARKTMELLALVPGESVLEVGCGVGVFLPLLAESVGARGRVVGIDYAPAMVAEAQARIAKAGLDGIVTVMEGDAYRLPFPDASFDVAHCERVLMHLDDPVGVLREMRRAVRPGGRIVAAETDWGGIRIDHPDREAIAMLFNRRLSRMRQPNMGLALYRSFAEAGLVRRSVVPALTHVTDLATLKVYGLDLESEARDLVAEGELSPEKAEAAVASLDAADRDHTFFAYGGMMVVAGQVPAS